MPLIKSQKEVHMAGNGSIGEGKGNKIGGLKQEPEGGSQEGLYEAEGNSVDEQDALTRKVQLLESCVDAMFSTISSLKRAYIQLQAAHSPYDPDKLRSNDKAVVIKLKKLSMLKGAFSEQQKLVSSSKQNLSIFQMSSDESSKQGQRLQKLEKALKVNRQLVETYEGYIEQFQQEMREKDEQISGLKSSLQKALEKAEKLERRTKKLERRTLKDSSANGSFINGSISESALVPQLFEMAVQETKDAASNFTLMMLKFMKEAQWDLNAAAHAIEPGIMYSKHSHKKLGFESYVCHRMFNGFENENFCVNTSFTSIINETSHKHDCLLQFQDMRFIDPFELVNISPDCLFGKFCHKKYLQTVHYTIEESFFGNLHQRSQISNGGHPTSAFYKAFLKMAKSVWLLHLLAFAFTPTIRIFQVKKDTRFDPLYMESVIMLNDWDSLEGELVSLTVFPGFFLGKQILKCQVYLEGMNSSD